jgi:acyl-CoA synthetase (AMP-forming)/AMP-acid ligase II
VSIKPLALAFRRDLLMKLVLRARDLSIRLHFDSPSAELADITFSAIAESLERHDAIGCTLPGRWPRSLRDAEWAIERNLPMRVVKGQWADLDHPLEDARHGFLTLVDRKKDLIITAGGKNISPANIEALLVRHPLISAAVVLGEARRYVTALLVPDPMAVDLAGVAGNEDFLALMQAHLDEVNAQLSHVEQVKKFAVIGEVWMPDSDVLTPTMKVRRRAVDAKYADLIDSLYA